MHAGWDLNLNCSSTISAPKLRSCSVGLGLLFYIPIALVFFVIYGVKKYLFCILL